ncbi:SPFH domain-containing protein [Nonomuraea dietziae]|uniref:Regulator of protease activity HflC (Stomatin/prohibitin superfamily) n=1 Tax=Nonomuraea dietziae TaxID=65515 RepID=A0A7W5VBB9_9ACTN|nr:SPFH domain-containing protein [Nonomuraea dietziae]MBB3724487.1 regulator of protease activity HflC (stomatin/prohibitin superfamily) [Nonomuraea dietziae]
MLASGDHMASIPMAPALAEPAVWVLLGVLPIVVIIAWALGVVGDDERLVVRRLGRVAGVRGPGLVVVWPGLEREVRVSLRLVCLDLFCAETVTRDGVTVRVKATAVAAVVDPVRFAMTMDGPLTATTVVAEGVLRRQIAQRNLADLPAMVTYHCAEMADRINDSASRWGVQVTLLDVADIQVPLRGELIAWAQGRTGVRRREKHPRG